MRSQLHIEKLPNNYLLASVTTDEQKSPNYITGAQGKPLKFLNLGHIKEFFEGHRIDRVYVVDDAGNREQIESW
jgi:hypothetical protein